VTDQLETGIGQQSMDIAPLAGEKIIGADHFVALIQEPFAEM
jgi:hypothetical protein